MVLCSPKLLIQFYQFQTCCIKFQTGSLADLLTALSAAPVVINQAVPKHHSDLTANLSNFLLFRAMSGKAEEKSSDGGSHLAVVACGPRLEETLTMLKSAVLLSNKQLTFHIFAEDDLQKSFRNAVSVLRTECSRFVLLLECAFWIVPFDRKTCTWEHIVSKTFLYLVIIYIFSLCNFLCSWSPGPGWFKWNLISTSIQLLSLRTMQKSGRSSSNLVPLRDSSCRFVNASLAIMWCNRLSVNNCALTQTVCFVIHCPADLERGGLFALRWHGHNFPAAGWGDLEPPLTFQLHPSGCNGTWTRGATHWLVQPFCTPPVLRKNWRQLRGHAYEHDATQEKIFSGMVW